ncbi:hypothetical protein Cgig2_009138 [Carnegiea gigantea]|uniref:Uncharacterized protein n=1 Tax=Carnegiea gigantea TaxID=171969 RepID=A0A9Q1JY76_9CARY|nr:hypothetical protein Cgig2_009138 [Carnegiea gigantea]
MERSSSSDCEQNGETGDREQFVREHKEAAKLMKKTYFSGGTVAASIADMDFVKHRDGIEELFEDGTASFLSIASISHGFRVLNDLTAPSISRHTSSLARYLRRMLLSLKHDNGADACKLYGGDHKEWRPGSILPLCPMGVLLLLAPTSSNDKDNALSLPPILC